jgi:SAM-dependent methyltransferase
MLSEARKWLGQDVNLIHAKASDFNANKKFDVITALFHVMSYQTSNNDMEKVFWNAAKHLTAQGLFIFDFWYGPAVLTDPPVIKIKRLENEEIWITRLAEPVIHYNEDIVDVNFEILVEHKKTHILEKLYELHRMRYFFLPEILFYAEKAGFVLINVYKWMTKEILSGNSWYGLIILRKL